MKSQNRRRREGRLSSGRRWRYRGVLQGRERRMGTTRERREWRIEVKMLEGREGPKTAQIRQTSTHSGPQPGAAGKYDL